MENKLRPYQQEIVDWVKHHQSNPKLITIVRPTHCGKIGITNTKMNKQTVFIKHELHTKSDLPDGKVIAFNSKGNVFLTPVWYDEDYDTLAMNGYEDLDKPVSYLKEEERIIFTPEELRTFVRSCLLSPGKIDKII